MVVEHQFVTVLDGPIALAAGQAFFEDLGFTGESADEKAVQLRRGRKEAPNALSLSIGNRDRGFWGNYKAMDFRLLPQKARIEFDRGRVTVAVSLIQYGKPTPQQERLLMAAANGVEMVLVRHAEIAVARASWDQIDGEVEAAIRKRKRRSRIILLVVLIFLALMIGLVVIAAVMSK